MKVTLPEGANSCTNLIVRIENDDGSVAWEGFGDWLIREIAVEALRIHPSIYRRIVQATGGVQREVTA